MKIRVLVSGTVEQLSNGLVVRFYSTYPAFKWAPCEIVWRNSNFYSTISYAGNYLMELRVCDSLVAAGCILGEEIDGMRLEFSVPNKRQLRRANLHNDDSRRAREESLLRILLRRADSPELQHIRSIHNGEKDEQQ